MIARLAGLRVPLSVIAASAGLAASTPVSGAAGMGQGGSAPVTFTPDVAPVLAAHCVTCHRANGSAPFPLTTYREARPRARAIADAVSRRQMPPWRAEGPRFLGQTRLTPREIETLQRWAATGAQEGAPSRPIPAADASWGIGVPDLVLTPESPIDVPADGPDLFRTFVVRVPLDTPAFVRGFEFRPGDASVVHHATVLIDRTGRSRELIDDRRPTEEGVLARTAAFPRGQILGWTPGQGEVISPEGLAWLLPSGADLVVQLHIVPTGRAVQLMPAIGLALTRDRPARAATLLRLGRQDLAVPPGASPYESVDAMTLPAAVRVLALKPHAHTRAKAVEAWAVTPGGERIDLIRIPEWDFHWQHTYQLEHPIALAAGTRVHSRFVYENTTRGLSADPAGEPVLWGPRSQDEMGDLWIQVVSDREDDEAQLERKGRRHIAERDAEGLEVQVSRQPGGDLLRRDLAALYLELGRPADAVRHYQAIDDRQNRSAAAKFDLGTALLLAGRVAAAVDVLQRAAELNPSDARTRTNLGNALSAMGRADAARRELEVALQLQPSSAAAHNNLANLLMAAGDLDRAVPLLHRALSLDDRSADAHFNLGLILRARREPAALTHLRQTVELQPEWPRALIQLAWVLAASADPSVRRPGEALRFAERAVSLTGRGAWEALDVLAVASAASGEFQEAIALTDEAMQITGADLETLRTRRDLFRMGRPFVER